MHTSKKRTTRKEQPKRSDVRGKSPAGKKSKSQSRSRERKPDEDSHSSGVDITGSSAAAIPVSHATMQNAWNNGAKETLLSELESGSGFADELWTEVIKCAGIASVSGKDAKLPLVGLVNGLTQSLQRFDEEAKFTISYNTVNSARACGMFSANSPPAYGMFSFSVDSSPKDLCDKLDKLKSNATDVLEKSKGKILISICMSERKDAVFGFAPISFEHTTSLKPSEVKRIEQHRVDMKALYHKMIHENKTRYVEMNCAAAVPKPAHANAIDPCPYPNPPPTGESDEAVEATRQAANVNRMSPAMMLASLLMRVR